MGVSLVDKTVKQEEFFKTIHSFNKEIVDDSAPRVFVISDPVKISVENAPRKHAHVPVHPDHPERGDRVFCVEGVFFLSKSDVSAFKSGELYRLMGCYNFTLDTESSSLVFHSEDGELFRKEKGKKIIHWIPVNESVPCRIVMPDNTKVDGFAETSILKFDVGTIVQCERFGFCRIDSLTPLVLYYGHR